PEVFQSSIDVRVAAVNFLHALDDCLALGDKCYEERCHASTKIPDFQLAALQTRRAMDHGAMPEILIRKTAGREIAAIGKDLNIATEHVEIISVTQAILINSFVDLRVAIGLR